MAAPLPTTDTQAYTHGMGSIRELEKELEACNKYLDELLKKESVDKDLVSRFVY
jgi:hypothetical protein